MPAKTAFNPLVLSKFLLWVIVVAVATWLLRRGGITPRRRLAFLLLGTLVFGFAYGILIPANPNPVLSLRGVLAAVLTGRTLVPLVIVMLIALLLISVISNKSICGWGCQLGLLQDLFDRIPLPKWRPPFWLTNSVRVVAFLGLVVGLAWAGMDWIKGVDPFGIFSLRVGIGAGAVAGAVLLLSLFVYRPWCRFLCPFGLASWAVEQVSLMRPRVVQGKCVGCRACVSACPTGAMGDFLGGRRIHTDCFACGACLNACSQEGALRWAGPWLKERRKGT